MPSRRPGIVAEAAAAVLAARISIEVPGLEAADAQRIARRQADDLVKAGWKVTAPVGVIPATARRLKAERTTT
jgi:hypothetical protein